MAQGLTSSDTHKSNWAHVVTYHCHLTILGKNGGWMLYKRLYRPAKQVQSDVPGGGEASGLVPAAGGGHRTQASDSVPERPRAEALALQAAERRTDIEPRGRGRLPPTVRGVMRWRQKHLGDEMMRCRFAVSMKSGPSGSGACASARLTAAAARSTAPLDVVTMSARRSRDS
jgi:hypothetical protein